MRFFEPGTNIRYSDLKAFPELRALVIEAVKLNLLEACYARSPKIFLNPFAPEDRYVLSEIGRLSSKLTLEKGMPSFSEACFADLSHAARSPIENSLEFEYLFKTHRAKLLTASITMSQKFDALKKTKVEIVSRINLIHDLFLENKLTKEVAFIFPKIDKTLHPELKEIYQYLSQLFFEPLGVLDKINHYLNGKAEEINKNARPDTIYDALFLLWKPALFFKYFIRNLLNIWPDLSTRDNYEKICRRFERLLNKLGLCISLLDSKMDLNSCFNYTVGEAEAGLTIYYHITWHQFEAINKLNPTISLKKNIRELKLLKLLLKRNDNAHKMRQRIDEILLKYRFILGLIRFHTRVPSSWRGLSIKYDSHHSDIRLNSIEDLNQDIRAFSSDFHLLTLLKHQNGKINEFGFCKQMIETFTEISKTIEINIYRAKNDIFLASINELNDKLECLETKIGSAKKSGGHAKNPSLFINACDFSYVKLEFILEQLNHLHSLYNQPQDVAPFWENDDALSFLRKTKNRGQALMGSIKENTKLEIQNRAKPSSDQDSLGPF